MSWLRLAIYRCGGALVTLCRSCLDGTPDDEVYEFVCDTSIGKCAECGRSA